MANKSLNQNINQAISDFRGIKQALIDKGVEIPEGTKTSEYGAKIGEIQSGGGLDTRELTDFYYFGYRDRFTYEQLEKLDTSNGTNFAGMFNYSPGLTTIPPLNTSKGTIFSSMFRDCTNLTSIPQLDTSKSTANDSMFYGCRNLTIVPPLNCENCDEFRYMFYNCSSLKTVELINTSKGTGFYNIFDGCTNLESVTQINLCKGTLLDYMFRNCSNLVSIPPLDTSSGTSFTGIFSGCTKLKTIELTYLKSASSMFYNCVELQNLKITGEINVVNNSLDLASCTKLTAESLVNVLNALKSNTSYSKYTITLGATNLAKLTASQKAIATNKNYTLA